MDSGQPSGSTPPPLGQSYGEGIKAYEKFLPGLLRREQEFRQQYDPQWIQEQQDLQGQFGPTQYGQQLQALGMLDPQWMGLYGALGDTLAGNMQSGQRRYDQLGRVVDSNLAQGQKWYNQLGGQISSDLAQGTHLTKAQERESTQYTRSAQTARGNTLGSAPAIGEIIANTQAGENMHQQRLQNATQFQGLNPAYMQNAMNYSQMTPSYISNVGNYLNGASPSSMIQGIAPVSADRSMAYTNPNAGFQGLQYTLGSYGLQNQGGGSNPWMSILGTTGQIAGALGSAAILASDKRFKTKIKDTGQKIGDVAIKTYEYKDIPGVRQTGVIAQEAEKTHPEAVFKNAATGMRYVDYGKLIESVS
jgi:hypothetical protein